MRDRIKARQVLLFVLIAFVSLLAGCSYNTDLVVVNTSDQSIEVRYKIRKETGPFRLPAEPATKEISQLHSNSKQWQKLLPVEYKLDPENRTITIVVKPNAALRVERLHRGGMQIDGVEDERDFGIEEIIIIGAYGEIKLQGRQVRKGFLAESKEVFTLTYK